MIRVLNLGAGVQSSTVLFMSCQGELPKLHAAVFADTRWEPTAVYRHLDFLASHAAKVGIRVYCVNNGNIQTDALLSQVRGRATDGVRYASMPLFTLSPDGQCGMVRRQCTKEYKVVPIERFIRRELLGLAPRKRAPPGAVEQWYGISSDEWQRVRNPESGWKTHYYPLVERRMTRRDCFRWLEENGYPQPPRSACIGCPFHSDAEWRDMKHHRPDEWNNAVEFDRRIRNCAGMRGQMFLHRSCQPLDQVDLRTDVDRGQKLLWQDECAGICGT